MDRLMKSTVRAPRGFKWKITTYSPTHYDFAIIELHTTSGHYVGSVRLCPGDRDKKIAETHSDLDSPYRGRGYGTKLYVRAIQWGLAHGYKVRSSGSSSSDAQRVWEGKGIRQYFQLRTTSRTSGYKTWYVLRAK